MNKQLERFIASIENLLAATLEVDDFLDFESLKDEPESLPFQPGLLLATAEPPPKLEAFMPLPPSGVGKFMPGAKAKYEQAVAEGKAKCAEEEALNRRISRRPHELLPVRPILEFDMVDPRFIQESDVLDQLDDRPNLMELTPKEFESLISNLFQKMGLETRQTQARARWRRRLRRVGPSTDFRRQGHHPGEALQEHGRSQCRTRPFRHHAERGCLKGNPRHDERLREVILRLRGRQTTGTPQRQQLSLPVGRARRAGARIEPPEDWVDPVADVEEPMTEEPDPQSV